MNDCLGSHRYHVADVAVVEAEGTVSVIALCVNCGDSVIKTHQVRGKVQIEKGKYDVSIRG